MHDSDINNKCIAEFVDYTQNTVTLSLSPQKIDYRS